MKNLFELTTSGDEPEQLRTALMRPHLRRALLELSEEESQIIYLRFWKGFDFYKISLVVKKRVSTVERALEVAVKKLKSEMVKSLENKVYREKEFKKCS